MEVIDRLHDRARETLGPAAYDYYAGAAGDERSLAENAEAWQHVWIRPRTLVGVGSVSTEIELLGTRLALPVLLAPTATQRLAHPDGELATARAAAAAGTVYCMSTRATTDLADVAEAAPGPRWFQLYVDERREHTELVLRRAAEHGYERIVLTVDVPVPGRRERERRHGAWQMPDGVAIVDHLGAVSGAARPAIGGWDAELAWSDLPWVAERSGLPVIVKGILTAEDAALAVEHGAEAVIVSNHGGRQLDGTVPTAVALREVVAEVGGRVPVLVDGGIRSGVDVFRALALGAAAVLVGRPYLWGLAAAGQQGVAEVVEALRDDLHRTMALAGCRRVADIGPRHVQLRGW